MSVDVKGPLAGSVNMMPMIDILFQLVIFFLIASEIQVTQSQLPVLLPQASEAQPLTVKPQTFIVTIDQAGQYLLGERKVNLEELDTELMQAAANNPTNQSVTIRADRRGAVAHTVAVMNLCSKAHLAGYQVEIGGE